jgi:hypothetical protein
MKNKILIITVALIVLACKKTTTQPQQTPPQAQVMQTVCSPEIKDVVWHRVEISPNFEDIKELRFNADSTYFENGTKAGKWSYRNCDTLNVQSLTHNNNWYKIKSTSTNDTLRLISAVYGSIKYYK